MPKIQQWTKLIVVKLLHPSQMQIVINGCTFSHKYWMKSAIKGYYLDRESGSHIMKAIKNFKITKNGFCA